MAWEKQDRRQKLLRTIEESIEQKAQERADRKLQYIIGRYGDANGERRKPYYRKQLIQEAKAALSWWKFQPTMKPTITSSLTGRRISCRSRVKR